MYTKRSSEEEEWKWLQVKRRERERRRRGARRQLMYDVARASADYDVLATATVTETDGSPTAEVDKETRPPHKKRHGGPICPRSSQWQQQRIEPSQMYKISWTQQLATVGPFWLFLQRHSSSTHRRQTDKLSRSKFPIKTVGKGAKKQQEEEKEKEEKKTHKVCCLPFVELTQF